MTRLALLLAIPILLFLSESALALTLTRSDSRLFIDGRPARLVGYGCYGMVSESSFERDVFLDTLADYDINYVRVWVNYHWTADLTPFAGNLVSKYDLLVQNEAFYDRLRGFVAAADERDIIVQVCLFDAVALTGDASSNRWPDFPYNTVNNLQDYLTSPGHFNDIPSAWWTEVNLPLIDRVVDELGDFGNVIYEAINEPDSHGVDTASPAFDQAVVDRLYERLHMPEYTGGKVISVNPEASVLFDWAATYDKVDLIARHIKDPGHANDFNSTLKPVIISNDGDVSMKTDEFGGLSQADRVARTEAMLANTFLSGASEGHNHFEFLDKGLYGSTWTSDDYDPSADRINRGILEKLSAYAPQPATPESQSTWRVR